MGRSLESRIRLYSEKGKALSTTAEKPISEVVGVKVRIAPDLCFPKKALDRPDHLLHREGTRRKAHVATYQSCCLLL